MGSVGRDAMPTAGASWIQECGAVAASLSLSSLFPLHSDQKPSSSPSVTSPGQNTSSNDMESHATTSASNLLETIMEDESGNSKRDNKENEGADCFFNILGVQHIPGAVQVDWRGSWSGS